MPKAINPYSQFSQKKKPKKPIDPNAPPRPTLLGHEKVINDVNAQLKEQQEKIDKLFYELYDAQRELSSQKTVIRELEDTVRWLKSKLGR
jgi:chromosome segregation ATPase